jgi:MATE family multidrug resistance protein
MHTAPVQPGPAASPLREVWSIAWPTVLTMTSYTVMQFVDKLMVAQVSPLQVAAQGNGGIWAFTPLAAGMGVLTVINTYVSQNLGAGTPRNGPRYAWAGLWLSAASWLVLMPWALALPWLFRFMGHGPELVRLESGYGQILLVGALPLLAARALNQFFFGMHRPRVVTVAAISGNLVNVVGNYALIYGWDGLPVLGLPGIPGIRPMGLYGAAIATIIGTVVEMGIPAAAFLGRRMNDACGTRAAWRSGLRPIRELIRIGWPAATQFGNELICWSIFMSALVGIFGTDHMTAGWAALGYLHLSFMPAVGFSVAVTSLVGRYIGAGQPDVAVARARLGLGLAMAYMTCCAVVFFVFRHPLIGFFVAGRGVPPEQAAAIVVIGGKLMICAAVFQTMDAIGIIYTGALRGAGDTVWPGVVTMLMAWLVLVAGGWLMLRLFPGLESVGPWIAAAAYVIFYGFAMWWRFESGRWRSISLVAAAPGERGPVRGGAEEPAPPAACPAGSAAIDSAVVANQAAP